MRSAAGDSVIRMNLAFLAALGSLDGLERQIGTMRSFLLLLR